MLELILVKLIHLNLMEIQNNILKRYLMILYNRHLHLLRQHVIHLHHHLLLLNNLQQIRRLHLQ
tara:strand:- start:47 stop:238 length:192 start_codon:yes stop_codon:yes gene_type:complete